MNYLAWIGAATINAIVWLHVLMVLEAVSPKLERAVLMLAVVPARRLRLAVRP